jgi:hypothetical protein
MHLTREIRYMAASSPDIFSVTNDECVSFLTFATPHKRAVSEASGINRAGIKRFKNSGVDTKAGLYVQGLRKKGEEKASDHLQWIIRFALLTGLITREQVSSLAESDVSVSEQAKQTSMNVEAEDRGWEEGHGGIAVEDNPYPLDSEPASHWAKGCSRGNATKQLELGLEGVSASARKEQPKARRERKTVSVVLEQSGGHGSVLPKIKRGPGRPRKYPLPEPQHLNA